MKRYLRNCPTLSPAALYAIVGLALASTISAQAAPATGKVFKAGAATSNITPALGSPIVGNWDAPGATQIHDELHVRCLALDDGGTKLVFAVVDSVGVSREIFDEAKKRIHAATGVPVANMMMSATHTHSATSSRAPDPAGGEGGYGAFLTTRIVDGVRRALNNLEPARIGWGAGQVPQHVFNRRWFLKDGKTATNPFGEQDRAVMNPGSFRDVLDRPAGPTNPEVYFISVQSAAGRPIALLANYWLHYVGGVGSGHISADYFAVFADRIQELLGADRQDPPFVGMLANGPCGDVNNNNYGAKSPAPTYPRYEKMRIVANDVAEEVLRVHRTIKFQDWVELKAAQSELELKMRRPTPALIARAEQVLARPANASPIHVREVNYAQRTIGAKDWPETVSIILQAFRIGGLGVAAVPFETFTETGLELKARSPFKDTFTIELANGSYGYLPTPEQHEFGGYETWLGTNRVEKDASRKIVARLLELFAQVK